jgi:hypothetical protein
MHPRNKSAAQTKSAPEGALSLLTVECRSD